MPDRKTALITGCSDGGIGSALVKSLVSRGCHVFATTRNVSKMATLANEANVTLIKLDVTDQHQVDEALELVKKETGGTLDILINNAGQGHFLPVLDEEVEQVKAMFEANVYGPLRVTKAFGPLVAKAKGVIINVGSCAAEVYVPYMATYAASKLALHKISETLRVEMKPFGVRVVCLITGSTKTNGLSHFEDLWLPEDSLYKRAEDALRLLAQGGAGSPDTIISAEEFAEGCMPLILGSASGICWPPGKGQTFLKYATSWLPTLVQDKMWTAGRDLDKL